MDQDTLKKIFIFEDSGFSKNPFTNRSIKPTVKKATELKAAKKIDKLLVMGCFSERFGSELRKELPEVDQFFGTNDQNQHQTC